VDNISIVGNSGGFLASVLGFGMLNSIETHTLAARSTIEKLDYEKLVKPNFELLQKKYAFLKALNSFDNNAFDKIIKFLGFPIVKQMIYNNSLIKLYQGTLFAKKYNLFRGNK
jgi:digeranylgeranylglycerophospholipid reductase